MQISTPIAARPPGVTASLLRTCGSSEVLRAAALFAAGLLLLGFIVCLHVRQGAAGLSYETIIKAVLSPDESLDHQIVRYVRLPRAVVGVLCGAALAMAGVILQSVTRNPLSSPQTLGVNAGAYLALVVAAVYAPAALNASPVFVTFAGAAVTMALVYVVAGGPWATPLRLVLAGAATSLALAAVTATLQLFHENETVGLFFWGAGSIIQQDWSEAQYALPRIAIAAIVALALARQLDLLQLGDDVARSLGQKVGLIRLGALGIALFLAATSVAVAGPIGFVGLVVPHLVRLLGVRRHLLLLPVAAVAGANVLVGADLVARMVIGSGIETPAGVVTALVGTPVFVWLARRAGQPAIDRAAGGSVLHPRSAPRHFPLVLSCLIGLVVVAAIGGLAMGDLKFSPAEVLAATFGNGDRLAERVVVDLRLPRIVVAGLAGAGLAASGVLLQAVVRNPLASPDIVGVAPGGVLAAIAALTIGPGVSTDFLPFVALAGGLATFALIYGLSRRAGTVSPARLILVGIAISAFCASAVHLLVVRAELRAAEALVWLSGTTYASNWGDVQRLAPWVLILLPVALVLSRSLDTLAFGEDVSRGLGLSVERTRLVVLSIAAGLAAATVSVVGALGFVGLVAPHASRAIVGPAHRRLLPASILLGAALVIAADAIGRTILAPREIPSGLITAVIGAPYFVFLMWRSRAGRT